MLQKTQSRCMDTWRLLEMEAWAWNADDFDGVAPAYISNHEGLTYDSAASSKAVADS
jgi:hypothetical protein